MKRRRLSRGQRRSLRLFLLTELMYRWDAKCRCTLKARDFCKNCRSRNEVESKLYALGVIVEERIKSPAHWYEPE